MHETQDILAPQIWYPGHHHHLPKIDSECEIKGGQVSRLSLQRSARPDATGGRELYLNASSI